MFNNIIYFIIVLLIFNISYQKPSSEVSLFYSLVMLFVTWAVFAGLCRISFQHLAHHVRHEKEAEGAPASHYHRLELKFSVLAIFLFALDVYFFHLRYWLQSIPGLRYFSALQGILALSLFMAYLGTIWYSSHTAYAAAFQVTVSRRAFIVSNIKLNVPILFPWVILSLIYDLIILIPWTRSWPPLNEPEGQMILFACFLVILLIFLPRFIQYWWECTPFGPTEKVKQLERFFQEKGFKYRKLLRWSAFQGRMLTAGIMGVVPRYRYILVTESLMEALSVEELEAVMAHEMGHAKYRHMLLYLLFILGYAVILPGLVELYDVFFSFLATQPFFFNLFEKSPSEGLGKIYIVFLLLILILTVLIYLRYVMGFFMRHFERQADLYSAVVMDSPLPTVRSLEKIALLSGKIRDLPSWHHFSIRERVHCLQKMITDPRLFRKQTIFIAVCLGIYLIGAGGLGYTLNSPSARTSLESLLLGKTFHQYQSAAAYQEAGKDANAIEMYEKIIREDPGQAVALNNLAWLLVTTPDPALRDPKRGLLLAKRAVALERSAMFLDTLAEAYYANGMFSEAVKTIKEALSLATERNSYYERQLEKFLAKKKQESERE
jgi:Zn-dependent protease with chaperone function